MAKFLRSRMSFPLSLGRSLLVHRFVALNHKEEDGQQLKFPFFANFGNSAVGSLR